MILIATPYVQAQTSTSSSRPLSSTVIASDVARNGELTLLVLWRGSPGWFSGPVGNSSGGGGSARGRGRESGWLSLTYGSKTFSIDFDYTAGTAKLLEQSISLAETNVVLVDEVDGPTGAHIIGRQWVDPQLPEAANSDPAITAIRRAPMLGEFLQCDIPMPIPAGIDTTLLDPSVLNYLQEMVMSICRQAITP